jgi:archaellum component FlaG (FlaF/FlaG flagellin family)
MRIVLLAAVLFAAAVAPALAARGVQVSAGVDVATARLGDPFVYTVEAHGPSDMRVIADPGPFVAIAPAKRRRTHGGEVVRIEQRLICLDRTCSPGNVPRRVVLPRALVISGGSRTLAAPAAITIRPRVPASAVAAPRARYRVQDQVRAASAPWLLVVAALVLLAAASLTAAVTLLTRSLRRSATVAPDARAQRGLEHALRLLRESARRPVPDRRRAADYVALTVAEGGGDVVAAEATRVAWSATAPATLAVEELADRVETTLGSDS